MCMWAGRYIYTAGVPGGSVVRTCCKYQGSVGIELVQVKGLNRHVANSNRHGVE